MTDKIRPQATKLWGILSNSETYSIYSQAVGRTLLILKEAAILVWLVFCLLLVLLDWIWDTSRAAFFGSKEWLDGLEENSSQQVASEAGRAILTRSQEALSTTFAQARNQLGLPEKTVPEVILQQEKKRELEPVPAAASVPEPQAAAVSTSTFVEVEADKESDSDDVADAEG